MSVHDLHGGVRGGGIDDMPSAVPSRITVNEQNTFSNWSSYQCHLLFNGWDISKEWQFSLTWFAVLSVVVVIHLLECAILSMKTSMLQILQAQGDTDEGHHTSTKSRPIAATGRRIRPYGWLAIKMVLSIISGIRYALFLMLMLVAMTFNTSLFIALLFGYLAGDYICCDFHVNIKMGAYNNSEGGPLGPAMKSVLCISERTNTDTIEYVA
jgi:Ctr copper transporter family